MKTMDREGAFTELVEAWANLAQESMRFGVGLVRSLAPVSSAVSRVASVASAGARMPTAAGCSCTIPPACWMPVDAGDVRTSACAGTKATLSIRVTNCGAAPRDIRFEATSQVTIAPNNVVLGPMEDATCTATVDVADGQEQRYLIWVRGCKTHFVRWTVSAGDRCDGRSSVAIDDCPDTIHHWYDHFYCQHPCQ